MKDGFVKVAAVSPQVTLADPEANRKEIVRLMKQAAARLRTSLAQYRELAAFTQFGSELDEATQKVLSSGARMMAALRQDRYAPLEDWQQALLILAVSGGYADSIEPDDIPGFSAELLAWFPAHEPALAKTLASGKALDDETRAALNRALGRFAEVL